MILCGRDAQRLFAPAAGAECLLLPTARSLLLSFLNIKTANFHSQFAFRPRGPLLLRFGKAGKPSSGRTGPSFRFRPKGCKVRVGGFSTPVELVRENPPAPSEFPIGLNALDPPRGFHGTVPIGRFPIERDTSSYLLASVHEDHIALDPFPDC